MCAPDEECILSTGECRKRTSDTCTSDSACSGGRACCDLGDGNGKKCNFKKCLTGDDCRAGSKNSCVEPISCSGTATAVCSVGVCKCEEPCGGADCGSGKCCDGQKNQCIDNPKPCPDLKCSPGTDPPDAAQFTTDPKTCKLSGPACECKKREPLPIGDVGLHSEIGMLNGKAVVSAYNETYGDLVVGYQQEDGSVKWEFIDGIPANGAVEGSSDGPRGGIKEAGDNVGLYTSLAVASDGTLHVSYFDATNGALKYARKSANKWELHTVDKNGKMVGRFTSLTLASNNPVIAYFVKDDGTGKTALRVARAKSAAPAAGTDWDISTPASAPLPACQGKCDASKKEVCIEEAASKFTCKVPTEKATSCTPKPCKDGAEACVSGACLKIAPDDANPPIPHGVGLFPSIAALASGGVVVTFYDHNNGDLKIAEQKDPASQFTVKTLASKGDVGQFTSVAIDGQGRIHIAYIDVDAMDLRYLRLSNQLQTEADELVDDGYTNTPNGGEDHFLADASIAVDSQGNARIVYQDASAQALKIAIRQGDKQWRTVKLIGDDSPYEGAFGFFADQVIVNDVSYISNFKYNLRKPDSTIDLRTWKP